MKNLKRISIIFLLTVIVLTIKSLAITGTVNAPNGLILRKEASKSGEVIMTISDKSQVEIIEKSGEWYKIKYGNNEGYLFAEYVDLKEEPKQIFSIHLGFSLHYSLHEALMNGISHEWEFVQ